MPIKIYNPNDTPYGKLSNNFIDIMRIDNMLWPTVTNYIYSNLVTTPIYKTILQKRYTQGSKKQTNIDANVQKIIENTETVGGYLLSDQQKKMIYQQVVEEVQLEQLDIYSVYKMYHNAEYFNIIKSSVEKAYNIKFMDDTLVQILLQTGNSPIEYVSNNGFLGTGPNGKGYNYIGKILVQIRHNLRIQKIDIDQQQANLDYENKILYIYIASKFLKKILKEHHDIKPYLGKTAENIVQENPTLSIENITEKQYIIDSFKRGRLEPFYNSEINNPGSLSIVIRKNELRNISQSTKNSATLIVFKLYAKYYAKKHNPLLSEEQINTAVSQLKSQAPGHRQYTDFVARVYSLYKLGELSETLSDIIDSELKHINIPSDQDILEAEMSDTEGAEVIEENGSVSSNYSSRSSSSVEENELQKALQNDDNAKKRMLIDKIQKYTGKTKDIYKKLSIHELEEFLRKRIINDTSSQPPPPVSNTYEVNAKKINITITSKVIQKLRDTLNKYKKEKYIHAYTKTRILSFDEIEKSYTTVEQQLYDKSREEKDEQEEEKEEKEEKNTNKYESIFYKELQESQNQPKGEFRTLVWVLHKQRKRLGGEYRIREESGKHNRVIKKRVWIPDPSMDIPEDINIPEQTEQHVFVTNNDPPIQIFSNLEQNKPEFIQFAPHSNYIISIDQVNYPNVSTYIETRLLASTGLNIVFKDNKRVIKQGMGLTKALEKIKVNKKFIPLDHINKLYSKISNETYITLVQTYLTIGINTKFQNKEFQDLLMLTGTDLLLYIEPQDMTLGSGTSQNRGINLVGKELMKKRTEILEEYKKEPIYYITNENIVNFINKDKFIQNWVQMRLTDMCETVYRVKQYLWETSKINITLDKEFIENVIDKIYQPCSTIFSLVSKLKDIPVPEDFLFLVKGCAGMNLKLDRDYDKDIATLDRQKYTEESSSFGKTTIPQSINNTRIFNKKQQMDTTALLNINHTQQQLLELQEKHRKERDVFYGIKRTLTTTENIQRNIHKNNIINEQIKTLRRTKKDKIYNYNIQINNIAKVYWDRIAVMVFFIKDHIKTQENSDINFKTVITQSQQLTSQKAVCTKILQEPVDNCIASALINILIGIESFKNIYDDKITLGKHDITLATSIILNKSVKEKHIQKIDIQKYEEELDLDSQEMEDAIQEELDEEKLLEQDEDDTSVLTNVVKPYGGIRQLVDEQEDLTDNMDEPRNPDMIVYEEEDAEFSFNGNIKDVEFQQIKTQLETIDTQNGTENIVGLTKFFIDTITAIKIFPMPNSIKTNRINFFATIK